MGIQNIKHREHHSYHHRRKRYLKYIILAGVAILLIGMGSYVGYAWYKLSQTSQVIYKTSGAPKLRSASNVINKAKPVSILLLGTDTGALGRSYKGRTDTIMMMTINPKTQKTTLMSLPRDMKVDLPGYSAYSPAKINAAYTYGGTKETIATLQKYMNVPIDYYLLINMGGLEKAINKIGGIDIVSPLTFTYEGTKFTKSKAMHMNGKTALKFSRMRYDDPRGDYGRQQRQRLVIEALMRKSISYKTILNNDFLVDIADEMKTDLTRSQLIKLALNYRHSSKNVKSEYVQGTSKEIGGQDFEVVSSVERLKVTNILRKSLGLSLEK